MVLWESLCEACKATVFYVLLFSVLCWSCGRIEIYV